MMTRMKVDDMIRVSVGDRVVQAPGISWGGVGWLQYFLDKMDPVYRKQPAWTGQDLYMQAKS